MSEKAAAAPVGVLTRARRHPLQIDGTLQARSTRRGIVAFPATRPKEAP